VRKHAWEFAKATLPGHGEFQSAYDALQLQACKVQRPTAPDRYTPPLFPTPTAGHVIWVDGKASTGLDNGTALYPYRTLKAAVNAVDDCGFWRCCGFDVFICASQLQWGCENELTHPLKLVARAHLFFTDG
jgi:hypothetical protein